MLMEKARKKALSRAWRERERSQGVFAVRCASIGQIWVSSTRNLDSQKNAVWFMLRQGGHPNPKVQAAWREYGEAAFTYEIVEELSEEGSTPAGFNDRLKSRASHWLEALRADALTG